MNSGELLIKLGVTPNYAGYRQTVSAVERVREDPAVLLLVTKQLYPAVAEEYNTNWRAVERNIRSAAAVAWKCNPGFLCQLAGYPMEKKPRTAQFIAILANKSEA